MLSLVILSLVLVLLYAVGRRYQVADWQHAGLNCADGWIRLYCRYYHRLGTEPLSLPLGEGRIVAANHISGLDPLLVIAACSRPVRFMIDKEQYQIPLLTRIFRAAGCIPVDRKRPDGLAFRAALRALRQGDVLGIFPQGRVPDKGEATPPLKPGVVKLAARTQTPVSGLYLTGIRGEHHIYAALLPRSHVQVVYHPPLDVVTLGEEQALAQLSQQLIPT